jgi:hypothetical protein
MPHQPHVSQGALSEEPTAALEFRQCPRLSLDGGQHAQLADQQQGADDDPDRGCYRRSRRDASTVRHRSQACTRQRHQTERKDIEQPNEVQATHPGRLFE